MTHDELDVPRPAAGRQSDSRSATPGVPGIPGGETHVTACHFPVVPGETLASARTAAIAAEREPA